MLNNLSYSSTLNRRERYSKIILKYWEVESHLDELEYLFWLEDVVTFSVGDDEVIIPISAQTTSEDDQEKQVDFLYRTPLNWLRNYDFPIQGKHKPSDFANDGGAGTRSRLHIFGEVDHWQVQFNEFMGAGGEYGIVYNTEERQWEFRLTPPSEMIGTNDSFSITLEGSVPSLVISGLGYIYTKHELVAYTEHYGVVDNELEVELNHIADRSQALNALQRILQKYNTLQPTYNYAYITLRDDQYLTNPPVVIDNNYVIPQSVSVELQGEHVIKTASDGVAHNDLGQLIYPWDIPNRRLEQVSYSNRSFDELQYNIRSFIY